MRIVGIETATPEYYFRPEDRFEVAESFFRGTEKQRRLLPVLFEKTGVQRRHSCLLKSAEGSISERQSLYQKVDLENDSNNGPPTAVRMQVYDREAGPLAAVAVENVLRSTGFARTSITHLVTVSCTGFAAPGFDLQLIDHVGLSSSVQRTHVGFMGCHGGLNGLRVATALANHQPGTRVLLCCTELCSLHYQYSGESDQLVANALFADGAMALIGVADETEIPHQTDTTGWRVADSASYVIPGSQEMMSWTIGSHGFKMSLSPTLPALIESHIRAWLETWLSRHSMTVDDIGGWAVHPGGPRILSSFQQAMDLGERALQHSHGVLRDYGNMSSATVFFILQRLRAAGNQRPCVALGFGPGITIEAALLLPVN